MKAAYGCFPMLQGRKADLSGYGYSRGVTDSCLDEPQCCMMLLQQEQKELLLITFDTVSIAGEFADGMKAALRRYGFSADQVIVLATHTHSGPGIALFPDDCPPGEKAIRNEELSDFLRNQIVARVGSLRKQLQTVKAGMAAIPIQGCYGNRNQPDGNCCKILYLIKLEREDGMPVAILANISCHSTILKADTLQFSADLAGAVRRELAEQFHAPCLITIGAAGDVSSRFQVRAHDYQAVLAAGKEIVRQTQNAQFVPLSLSDPMIEEIPLRYDYDPGKDSELSSQIEQLAGTPMEFMVPTMRRRIKHGIFHIDTKAFVLRTGDLNVVFFPGELVTALGDRLRDTALPTVICCYANDYWQYFVAEEEYGRYFETANSICPRGLADQFIEAIKQRLTRCYT